MTVLQEAGFDEVEMLVQRHRGALMEFHYRAKATFTTDCIGILLCAPSRLRRLKAPGAGRVDVLRRAFAPFRGGDASPQGKLILAQLKRVALSEGEEQEASGKDGASVLDTGSTAGEYSNATGC